MSSPTDDEVFYMAELTCVIATRDPGWTELHSYFAQLAHEAENPGFKRVKKGRGMSQNQLILSILKKGKSLTRLKAMHYGVMNLTARISELRTAGYDIKCRMREDESGREYGEFYLEGVA